MKLLEPSGTDGVPELADVASKTFAAEPTDDRAGAALGWFGVGVPEQLGGAGGTLEHLAVIVEAAGNAAAASAIPWTTGVLAQMLTLPDLPASAHSLLPSLCAGTDTALVPVSRPRIVAERLTVNRGSISGTFLARGATAPTLLMVPSPDASEVLVLPVDVSGVKTEPVVGIDASRPLHRVTLTNVASGEAAARLADSSAVERMTGLVGLITALDSVGVARESLDVTLTYLAQREQFGRQIGSFQALKHRCATAYVMLRLAHSAASRAARETDHTLAIAAAVDGTRSCTFICSEAVQLHGGIGFSWESNLHRYLKRARVNEMMWTSQ
jgi:alkylation response protein AidB-like acyl-CoA dehydrogenase